MYVVFRHWDYDTAGIGPGQARGPFTLFDGEGRLVPVYMGANYLAPEPESDIFPYAGDNRVALAQVILHGSGEHDEKEWTAQVLHIVPVTPDQQSVLSVILGPATYGHDDECVGFSWGWRRRDLDGDGVPEIEIGPLQNRQGEILPRAVYRWSRKTGHYDGPAGSAQEGFLRIDGGPPTEPPCAVNSKAIEQFALARLRLAIPADPSAIRRGKCRTTFGSGGTP